jgi:polar amino acid transport system substrate-binding protein
VRNIVRRHIIATFAATSLLLAACGNGNGNDIDENGNGNGNGEEATGVVAELQESGVTLGVANEVPFGYIEDGEPTGIGPDVAQAVLEEMGIEVNDAEVVEFGELISGLQAGTFDLVTAGMYITPDRAQQVHFTDPDYCVQESLAVEEGNPMGIEDYQSLVDDSDIIVAVASGTVEVDYLEDAGVPDEQVETFGDIDGMYRALEAGEVDAVTGTLATVQTQAEARDGIEALPGFFPTDADGEDVLPCGAHAFDDEEFRDAFNEVLNEFREDGTTLEIITAYEDFTDEDVEMANELTLEDFLD